jgi:hypothetical protein
MVTASFNPQPEIKSANVAEISSDERGSGRQFEIIPGTRTRPSVAVLTRKDGSVLRLSID